VQEAEEERRYADKVTVGRRGGRAARATFVLLFLAEWGDLSQLLTAGLVPAESRSYRSSSARWRP
jgi:putative Ca2+/H+ antiporter (TMEM165/GDT1 family)